MFAVPGSEKYVGSRMTNRFFDRPILNSRYPAEGVSENSMRLANPARESSNPITEIRLSRDNTLLIDKPKLG